ncbi:MAG: TetR/AcrR family transcriptional regulator [Chloroflexota bacterium]
MNSPTYTTLSTTWWEALRQVLREEGRVFGKPGRPPEDRLLRRREIYEAVAPMILSVGVRQLSMRQAAEAACLSIGGLYHYFPNKRDLVLYGLNAAALERRRTDFWVRYGHLETEQPAQLLDALVHAFVEKIQFVRPSVHASLELGPEPFWESFEVFIDAGINDFAEALGRVARMGPRDARLFQRAVRRVFFAALLDPSTTPDEARAELYALVTGRPLTLSSQAALAPLGQLTASGSAGD